MGKYLTTFTSDRDLPRRFIEPTALRNSHDFHDKNTKADMIRIPSFQVSNKDFQPTTVNELESLLNTIQIFSTDISVEFSLKKCATLTIHKGKTTHTEGLTLSNNNTIKGLSLEESYRYLGVLHAEDIKHRQVKKQTTAEYTNRVRQILKSKLNGGNTIQAINNWAVPVIRYTSGIVDWTIAELKDLDRKTRKLMTAHRTLHPQSDIDRLYLPRRIWGRGLLQIRKTVK